MPFLKWFFPDPNHNSNTFQELEKRLAEIENQLAKLREAKDWGPPVIIEHADKVIVEKMEYSNHFGSLEIDNLQGQLNIGRNHMNTIPPDKLSSLKKGPAVQDDTFSEGPRCNIKARGNNK